MQGMYWVKREKVCQSKSMEGLGFRDLEIFNFSLLTKQCGELVQNHSSLVATMLKGKYFTDSSFMEYMMGNRLSYVWSSIWEEKVCWRKRLGKGKQKKIMLAPLNRTSP